MLLLNYTNLRRFFHKKQDLKNILKQENSKFLNVTKTQFNHFSCVFYIIQSTLFKKIMLMGSVLSSSGGGGFHSNIEVNHVKKFIK